MGESYADHGLVFCRPDGTPHHPERFGREFTRQSNAAKVVQERLGHSSIAITLDLYTHVAPSMRTDAAERVAGLIFGSSS